MSQPCRRFSVCGQRVRSLRRQTRAFSPVSDPLDQQVTCSLISFPPLSAAHCQFWQQKLPLFPVVEITLAQFSVFFPTLTSHCPFFILSLFCCPIFPLPNFLLPIFLTHFFNCLFHHCPFFINLTTRALNYGIGTVQNNVIRCALL